MLITSKMEPMIPARRTDLEELALEVYKASARLAGRVHPLTAQRIIMLLRNVNSYYSNLIEGIRTTLLDIESSLTALSNDEKTRRLQLLHKRNIAAQETIERQCLGTEDSVTSAAFLCRLHSLLFKGVPEEFLVQQDRSNQQKVLMTPGLLRDRDVQVGTHLPPVHEELPQLMKRFEDAYSLMKVRGASRLVAAAASHHRLLWIHPFLEGNGRVARLFTDAYLTCSGLEGYGLWTLSRGLARKESAYKEFLSTADSKRKGDYDGRGALSEDGLRRFCFFILETALDQATFMDNLLSLEAAVQNIELYCRLRSEGYMSGKKPLPKESSKILTHTFIYGRLPKGEVEHLIGASDRKARDVVKQLVTEGFLKTENQKAPLTIGFPSEAVQFIFPELCDQGAF